MDITNQLGKNVNMDEPLNVNELAEQEITEILTQMGFGETATQMSINPITIAIFNKAHELGFKDGYHEGYMVGINKV